MNKEKKVEILLVEDNEAEVFLIKEAFDEWKLLNSLNTVHNGLEAMKYLKKEKPYENMPKPDLIILDLNMPKMNGREVLNEVKKDDNIKHIPIVVMTTSDDEEDIIQSYKLHANCYIRKPVDFKEFSKIILSIQSFWFQVVTLP